MNFLNKSVIRRLVKDFFGGARFFPEFGYGGYENF